MKAILTPTKLKGSLEIIPSKSHAHRLLIAAYLANCPECVNINLDSEDIEATRNSLAALFPEKEPKINESLLLDCNESGSTLRFLLPVAKVLQKDVTFLRSGRLPDRPLAPLDREMRSHGCVFITNENDKSLIVRGQLKGGLFTLPGNVSSQFVTGLLFALPLTKEGGNIKVEKPVESKPYIDLTISVLKKFNIVVAESESEKYVTYTIAGNQKYEPAMKRRKEPLVMEPEGDWSNGAFWLAANVLGSEIELTGLDENAVQGDRRIVDIITDMMKIIDDKEQASVLEVDARNIPDLVPIISVLACGLGVETHIVNAERLRAKESDRLSAMEINLGKLGFNVNATADGLHIFPEKKPLSDKNNIVEVESYNDHRIVMAMAIASTFLIQPLAIKDCEAVNKSYPTFFDEFARLGGQINVER